MDMQSAIRAVTEGRDLSAEEMTAVMRTIMTGEATQAQIGGFLVGLRMKGETVDEIAAAAAVMRELAARVPVEGPHLVDTCGTGGDAAGTFNISTACAFVVAAAGGRVAKHGNRSVSSRSGSADVLEAAGVNLELTPEQVGRCVNELGVGFMFAPRHHSAMRHAIGPRREMGVRTIFNVLGPLTNPAGAPNQVIGVFSDAWVEPLAQVLARLGGEHVLVVHAEDGMDEISVGAATHVAELKDGEVRDYFVTPEEFGLQRASIGQLAVDGPEQSLDIIRAVLDNEAGPARDIVALNAGAAIYAAGLADSLAIGIELAGDVIADGSARTKVDRLVAFSNSLE
ncbi:MAG: anthranilate phosphoribosyltransferase [Gammaproteobacteria bacterium]|nr:anthranilate phosphoribosyltransferase [Gammaproteobacteria bacterium]NIR90024.1 anthranilate phosphoribosyltransferase [Gammaproteobacteria bacterium]NIR99153.1 anthranilate phosphoribosyltransferase [Gammaproteobacteria bacterium]NIT64793.1 anthranilate phosphoribosyltransferase [Gammaproteobacteria bacterium]NIV53643.1 anthranilate phosphoribosyltransferase [Gammaproteobacteria bacterium]